MPRHVLSLAAALTCLAALTPGAALAYIGPGVGAGALAAVVGVVGSILLAIVGILYYPIKRMLKRKKSPAPAKPAE
jgi:membrane protein implicated in regulation of membrane protease activity